MDRKKATITISVPQGSGSSNYKITLSGTRCDILKALCEIYGGYLVLYDVCDWYDCSEQTITGEAEKC